MWWRKRTNPAPTADMYQVGKDLSELAQRVKQLEAQVGELRKERDHEAERRELAQEARRYL